MSTDRIADKVRKLLALASDPGAAPNEAETAARQAAALMAKHQLDEADLQLSGTGGKLIFDLMEGYAKGTRPGKKNAKEVPPWIAIIGFGVKVFTRTYSSLGSGRVYFKGQRCDVELAIWMHETIVDACYAASQGEYQPNAWRNGYAAAVQRRLKDLAKIRNQSDTDTPASASGTSLVAVNNALQEAMAEKWGGPGGVRSSRVSRSDAGYAAGMSAHLPTARPIAGAGALRLSRASRSGLPESGSGDR